MKRQKKGLQMLLDLERESGTDSKETTRTASKVDGQ